MKLKNLLKGIVFSYNIVKVTKKRRMIVIISFLIIILSMFPIINLEVTRRILNGIQNGSPFREIVNLFVILISIQLFTQVVTYFIQLSKNLFFIKMSNLIPELIMNKISRIKAEDIFHEDTQDELYFLRTQTPERTTSVFENLFSILGVFTTLISMLIYVASWNIGYAVIIICISIPLGITQVYFNKKKFLLAKKLNRPYREQFYLQYIATTSSYLKEIVTNNSMGRLIKDHKSIFNSTYTHQKKLMKKEYFVNLILSLLSFIVIGYLELRLILKAVSGDLLLGTLTSLLQAINSVSVGINTLILILSNFYGDLLYVNNLKKFLDTEDEVAYKHQSSTSSQYLKKKNFSLKLKNISFHIDNKIIFEDLNYEFNNKKIYGILGENGSGKSTLLEIIQGIKVPSSGEILFDGKNINNMEKNERFQISQMLFQNPSKYEFTFDDNIRISDTQKLDPEDIFEYINELDSENKLKSLFSSSDERLGEWYEDSRPLSGGQWQSIAIYRLLYKSVPIYLIDEPTNNLDYIAIQKVKNIFKKIKNTGALIIVVSHDLEFIEDMCDELINMEKFESKILV